MADNCSKHNAINTATINQSSPSKKRGFPKISLLKKRQFLIKHIKKKLQNKLICDECQKKFPNWWERREHWLESGHKTQEQCRWCGKKTFTLQSHICKQHWGTAVMCSNCGYMFMYQEDLKKHQLQHDDSEYRCSHCGCRKKDEEQLRIHVQDHFLHEKYGCNICEKRYKKKKNLERHLIYIHFICQYCGGTCSNLEDLKKHVKIHDDLKCLFCNKVFSQKTRLKYHYQLLHGHQDFYQCTLCFQRFAKKSVLLDHLRLRHKGKPKFCCKICAIPFLYWQQYQNHFEKVHVKKDVNQFDCSFCDYTTNLKYKLKCHVEKSSGTGFFCKKCQLRFDCKGRFDKHMKDHDGDTVWECDYCPKAYKSDNILKHHMQMIHKHKTLPDGGKVYPCLNKGCDRYYITKSSLARHVRRTHEVPLLKNTRGRSKTVPTKECISNVSDNGKKIVRNSGETHYISDNDEDKGTSDDEDKEISSVSEKGEDKESSNVSSKGDDKETTGVSDKSEDKETYDVSGDEDKETSGVSDKGDDKESINVSGKGEDKESSNDSEEDSNCEKSNISTQSDLNQSHVRVSNGHSKQPDKLFKEKGYHHMVEPLGSTVEVDVYNCSMCAKFWFAGEPIFRKHMRTHKENVWIQNCEHCDIELETPEEVVKHNVEEHLKVEYTK